MGEGVNTGLRVHVIWQLHWEIGIPLSDSRALDLNPKVFELHSFPKTALCIYSHTPYCLGIKGFQEYIGFRGERRGAPDFFYSFNTAPQPTLDGAFQSQQGLPLSQNHKPVPSPNSETCEPRNTWGNIGVILGLYWGYIGVI